MNNTEWARDIHQPMQPTDTPSASPPDAVADLIASLRGLERRFLANTITESDYNLFLRSRRVQIADALESCRTEIESLKSQIRKVVFDYGVIEKLRLQEIAALRAERDRMQKALTTLREWDMLDVCNDGPWAKELIDNAIKPEQP